MRLVWQKSFFEENKNDMNYFLERIYGVFDWRVNYFFKKIFRSIKVDSNISKSEMFR